MSSCLQAQTFVTVVKSECVNRIKYLRRPAFKSGHGEQSHHGHEHVVKVEVAVVPLSFVDGWLVHIPFLIQNVGAPVSK